MVKYKTKDEIKNKIDSIYNELVSKYEVEFETNYVELEYSTKLVPDGKRCRMRKPYFKNILFIGDAAGRGIFLGPRIEGINVGIDDAVRAAEAVSKAIDQNNFHSNDLGERYTKSVEESPYTRDMKEIDKNYLKAFLDCTKQVPKDTLGYGYGTHFQIDVK